MTQVVLHSDLPVDFGDREIRQDARREQFMLVFLSLPALAVMGALLFVPLAWLVGLSFIDEQGGLTMTNYSRLFIDGSLFKSLTLTLQLAFGVTFICALVGYVLAYAITLMPRWLQTISLALVALPFWTSALVRTYAWLVLLQRKGVINKLLVGSDLVAEPLHLVHNLMGTMIGMVHIMLPFMVFPLYAAMQRIDADLMRASLGLGASVFYSFRRVYLPQSLPGLAAGIVLVFVLSLGFYITPAILGGGRVMVIAMIIERDVNLHLNWGPASAIAVLFLVSVVGLFAVIGRFLSIERIFQGRA
ncbi:MAG: ABC transporter permease [Pseudaminobacter sp.]